MKARLNHPAPLYKERDPASPVLLELPRGSEFVIVRSTMHGGKDWLEVSLASGQRGFLVGPNAIIALQEVVLDQDRMPLVKNPVAGSETIGEVARNDRLVVLETIPPRQGETGPGWCLVRHDRLGEGYVPGNARIRPADVPELTWWRSFLGGGKIIAGIASIGAIFLGIRGDWQSALLLVLLCFVTGGLAGIVYHATTPLREKEFGPHLSWGLVLATYLFSVALLITFVERMGIASTPSDVRFLATPLLASMFVGLCVLVGCFFGYQEQRQRHQDDGRPWTWGQRLVPLLGGIAIGAVLIGGIWLFDVQANRALATEASEPPQEMKLRDLLIHGHGENRYLVLKEFRHADQWIVEEASKRGNFTELHGWAILVSGKETKLGPGAKTPKYTLALVSTSEIVQEDGPFPPGPQPVRNRVSQSIHERAGMYVMVMNGIRDLPRSVQEALLKLSPETEIERVTLLSKQVQPIPLEQWQESRQLWLGILLAGAGLLALTWWWGRRSQITLAT